MSRIADVFARKKAEGRAAFMPYLMAGDPDLETTRRLIPALAEAGAGLIELGVPFSDPLADGPTIQEASVRALRNDTTLAGVLEVVRDVRQTCDIPICLMGYYNPFFQYGIERLCRDAADAGADGFIIPDLQPDDVGEIRPHAEAAGLDTVFLVAPTSTDKRLDLAAQESRGFVYAVSLTGVTGARDALPPDLTNFIARARKHVSLPIAVGFGIKNAAMARQVAAVADGVIVGSAVVKIIAEAATSGSDPVPPAAAFVRELADAV